MSGIGPLQAPARQFEIQVPTLPSAAAQTMPQTARVITARGRSVPIPLPTLAEGDFEGIREIQQFAEQLAALAARRITRQTSGADYDSVRQERYEAYITSYRDYVLSARLRFSADWQAIMQRHVRRVEQSLRNPRRRRGEPPPPRATEPEILDAVNTERTRQFEWAVQRFQRVRRGWMISMREKLDFDTLMPSRLRNPRWTRPAESQYQFERVPIAPYGSGVDVHPALRDFLHVLHGNPTATAPGPDGELPAQRRIDRGFNANNYSHGHGSFHVAGVGLSVDLTLNNSSLDERGFYRFEDAVALMMRVHNAATALGFQWIVLYNDYAVAAEVNTRTRAAHMVYTGGTRDSRGNITRLNWHGPEVLHFHLDITPPASYGAPAAE